MTSGNSHEVGFGEKREASKAAGPFRYSQYDDWSSSQNDPQPPHSRPIPSMPSPLFVSLAQSQLELLAHSLPSASSPGKATVSSSKIKSMALYLPQENGKTGQLEFLPAVLYPPPSSERVFIASGANSGVAPSLPKTLTKLPGFAHAASLLPGYPMVSSATDKASAGVGVVEEVLCDLRSKNSATALSIPLVSGSQTVGVLLVSPSVSATENDDAKSIWTTHDKEQVSRAAQSLSMALLMDMERTSLQLQTDHFRQTLSDSLHQVKNPLQALRTYGKLLQRRIANADGSEEINSRFLELGHTPQLLALAQHLMVQSDRVVELLLPMDLLVAESSARLYLTPSPEPKQTALTRWQGSLTEFSQVNSTVAYDRQVMNTIDHKTMDFTREPNAGKLSTRQLSQTESTHAPSPTMVGDVEMQMSFIQDVLDPIFSAFEAIAFDRGIDFQVLEDDDDLPGVMVCPKSLQEAVSNVIDNAMKYVSLPKDNSPFTRNPVPKVRVRLQSNRNPVGVTILVEDNGPGIPHNDREAIFQRGYRSKRTSGVEGSGIGLDISRSLMARMGGSLVAADPDTSTSLDGATMKLKLFRNPEMTDS